MTGDRLHLRRLRGYEFEECVDWVAIIDTLQ